MHSVPIPNPVSRQNSTYVSEAEEEHSVVVGRFDVRSSWEKRKEKDVSVSIVNAAVVAKAEFVVVELDVDSGYSMKPISSPLHETSSIVFFVDYPQVEWSELLPFRVHSRVQTRLLARKPNDAESLVFLIDVEGISTNSIDIRTRPCHKTIEPSYSRISTQSIIF